MRRCIYRFFSIALAVLPRIAVAEIAGFDALAASYGCAALIADARPPRPTSTGLALFLLAVP